MPNLLLIGPTNNGTSMLIEKFRRAHLVEPAPYAEADIIPVVTMQMPSDPSISRFYALLLTRLGVPLHGRRKVVD
jgi:Bacterial TniB protein